MHFSLKQVKGAPFEIYNYIPLHDIPYDSEFHGQKGEAWIETSWVSHSQVSIWPVPVTFVTAARRAVCPEDVYAVDLFLSGCLVYTGDRLTAAVVRY